MAESTRLLETEPPPYMMKHCRLTTLGSEGRVRMREIRAHCARDRVITQRLHEIGQERDVLAAAEEGREELGILAEWAEKDVS